MRRCDQGGGCEFNSGCLESTSSCVCVHVESHNKTMATIELHRSAPYVCTLKCVHVRTAHSVRTQICKSPHTYVR